MKIRLTNNTDYRRGIEFSTAQEVKEFIGWYYHGQRGNLYGETWEVEDEDDSIYDVLEPPIADGMSWTIKEKTFDSTQRMPTLEEVREVGCPNCGNNHDFEIIPPDTNHTIEEWLNVQCGKCGFDFQVYPEC